MGKKRDSTRPAPPAAAAEPLTRTEHDSLGELQVPADALWAAQTQRAVENFPVSGWRMPRAFIRALGLIKATAAEVNADLELLDPDIAAAIVEAALAVAAGAHDEHFPVDVFQTGSGTSSNMNANEVIAQLASRALGAPVHPNDHVNMSQSSNDVIPTAIHISAVLSVEEELRPALKSLAKIIDKKGKSLKKVVKTGRTHLMDAMPLRFDQELSGWSRQIKNGIDRLDAVQDRIRALAQGGTAVGTGVNAHALFSARFCRCLSKRCGVKFEPSPNFFESLSSQDAAVELSGQLRTIAVGMLKIANDLRWMNSGPLAGLGEIELQALQPGSSIMPGKVNPVIPESVAQVCAQVIGCDATIAVAGSSGNFQLNVMLPVIAWNLLTSIRLLSSAAHLLGERAIGTFAVRAERLDAALDRNPILITGANRTLGYEKGAAIAKRAYAEGRPVLDVAEEETGLPRSKLAALLDPYDLTKGGVHHD